MPSPLAFEWVGDGFRVLPRFAKEADKRYVIGEKYLLDEIHERSTKSHNAYFAAVKNGWMSLPEELSERFPSPTHLRKHCLLKAGYYVVRDFVAASNAEAIRIAAFMRPNDEYAIYTISGKVVTEYKAKSQRYAAMGAKDFQASKTAVLDIISAMIGTKVTELRNSAADTA